MPFILRKLFKFLVSFLLTFFAVTALLYAVVMFTPAETRATLYMPRNTSPRMTEEQNQKMLEDVIERYQLNAPYHVQYFHWVANLFQGNWGYSPTLQQDVFSALVQRTPATAELTLCSILIYFPLGLISGVVAGSKKNKMPDHAFRAAAFIATSLPSFILAIVLMVIFYIDLHWFAPGQLSPTIESFVASDLFHQYTGFMIIDGLLNGRPDISVDVIRHLAMPACTLAFSQWAILGRLTRVSMIEEMQQDYIVSARARGISEKSIIWRHSLGNAISPVFTNTMLSAASLLTGVYVVEIIFNYPGISYIAVKSMAYVPDAPAALGFAIYSVIVVLILMGILDFTQSLLDPRIREDV